MEHDNNKTTINLIKRQKRKAMDEKEKSNFQKRIESQENEKLMSAFLNKENYQPQYIELVEQELEKRGYILNELKSSNETQYEVIEKETDEELLEIYTNPDKYDRETVELAQKEMTKRDLMLQQADCEEGKQGNFITGGYIFAVLGGFIGLIIACNYAFSKQYNESTRKHGKRMLLCFAIVNILAIMIIMAD